MKKLVSFILTITMSIGFILMGYIKFDHVDIQGVFSYFEIGVVILIILLSFIFKLKLK